MWCQQDTEGQCGWICFYDKLYCKRYARHYISKASIWIFWLSPSHDSINNEEPLRLLFPKECGTSSVIILNNLFKLHHVYAKFEVYWPTLAHKLCAMVLFISFCKDSFFLPFSCCATDFQEHLWRDDSGVQCAWWGNSVLRLFSRWSSYRHVLQWQEG